MLLIFTIVQCVAGLGRGMERRIISLSSKFMCVFTFCPSKVWGDKGKHHSEIVWLRWQEEYNGHILGGSPLHSSFNGPFQDHRKLHLEADVMLLFGVPVRFCLSFDSENYLSTLLVIPLNFSSFKLAFSLLQPKKSWLILGVVNNQNEYIFKYFGSNYIWAMQLTDKWWSTMLHLVLLYRKCYLCILPKLYPGNMSVT